MACRTNVEGVDASLEILGENALPASLEITLESSSNAEIIEDFATKINRAEFDSVDYGVEWINRFNEFIQLLQVLGTLLGGLIVIAATFVVSNTIHLVVYNRRNELEILQNLSVVQICLSSYPSFLRVPYKELLDLLVPLVVCG